MKLKNKSINRLIILVIGIMIFTMIYTTLTKQSKVYSIEDTSDIEVWSQGYNGYSTDNSAFMLEKTLVDEHISNKVLVFFSNHEIVNVFADEKLIYSIKPNENSPIKTTGDTWNIVPMKSEYNGKEIKIERKSIYNDNLKGFDCYYGTENDVFKYILDKDLDIFIIGFMIMLVGIVLLFYSHIIIRKKYKGQHLRYLADFSIVLGVWRMSEVTFTTLLIKNGIMWNMVRHISLMLIPFTFTLFICSFNDKNEHKTWNKLYLFNVVVIVTRLSIQFAGILDLYQTLWITHINIFLLVVLAIRLSIYELKNNMVTVESRLNLICIFTLMILTMIDLYIYKTTRISSNMGPIGYLIYIVLIGIGYLKKSDKMIEHIKELEIYKKLAYIDDLTGMYNRLAFKQDTDNYNNEIILAKDEKKINKAIIMFDMNDLKKCNDNYGHSYGDEYISIVSKVFEEVFNIEERCYRIGGDEFCAIIPSSNRNYIEDKLYFFDKKIRDKNKNKFVVNIGVSYGYSIFDSKIDKTLEDTKNRADINMYKHKRKFKNINRSIK